MQAYRAKQTRKSTAMSEFKIGDVVKVKDVNGIGIGQITAVSIGELEKEYEVEYFINGRRFWAIFLRNEIELTQVVAIASMPSKQIIHGKGQGQWEN